MMLKQGRGLLKWKYSKNETHTIFVINTNIKIDYLLKKQTSKGRIFQEFSVFCFMGR